MSSQAQFVLGVFLVATLCLTSSTYAICPNVPKGDKHFTLIVEDAVIPLPGNRSLKQGLLYNGSYVGPTITATLGEIITVDVINKAKYGTSVHWHGQDLPNAAWADGVAGVSQRPIPPGETMRYRFKAEPAGTFWYHSHTGMQFGEGLRGPLIIKVRTPRTPSRQLYDEEATILLTDQSDVPGEEELKSLEEGGMAMGGRKMLQMAGPTNACSGIFEQDFSDQQFYTLLANGKGWVMDPVTEKPTGTPYVLKVQKGKRYRLRLIQGSASWGIKLNITDHKTDIIMVSGGYVHRLPASAVVMTSGERVDLLFTADQPVGNYWINIATLTGLNSPAVLSYEGAPDPLMDPKMKQPQLELGCLAILKPGEVDIKITPMTAIHKSSYTKPPAKASRVMAMYLPLSSDPSYASPNDYLGPIAKIPGLSSRNKPVSGCNSLADGSFSNYCWTINWVPFKYAKNSEPLLFPSAELTPQTYVENLKLNEVVDIVLISPNTMVHPMHLHGQRFWVLGSGNGEILKKDGKIDYSKLNLVNPPLRDTQPVPQALVASPDMGPGGASPSPDMGMGGMAASPSPSPSMGGMGGMGGMGRRSLKQGMGGMGGMDGMGGASPSPSMGGMGGMGGASPSPSMGDMGGEKLIPGWTVLRIQASNPGVWAFHCHIDLHANSGMIMGFKIGNKHYDLPSNVTSCWSSSMIGLDGSVSSKSPSPEMNMGGMGGMGVPSPSPVPSMSGMSGMGRKL